MSIIEAIILGLVQGLTEFIPVSSSGHLVFLHEAFGITENGLLFDVALHVGTLGALLIYFYKDILLLVNGILGKNHYTRAAWLIVAATIPAIFSGTLLQDKAESVFRSVPFVAVNLILVAFLMLGAEWFAKRYDKKTKIEDITPKQAVTVGVAQALAVIPGVSRSGGTITAGLFMGLDRVAATRFSFLLGIPIMFGAIIKVLTEDGAAAMVRAEGGLFAIGIITALLSGLFAIRFLLKYLARHTLAVFAYYRIALGTIILLVSII